MTAYKEIVTKAIIGKGRKKFVDSYQLEADVCPTNVLGCWVINHKFKGYKAGEQIGIDGCFDVNIWYSYDEDSKTMVANKRVEYNTVFNVRLRNDNDLADETDIIVRSLNQPNCSDVSIDGNIINFTIEKELGVEIVGETKIKIAVEDNEDPWDIIEDEITEKELSSIDVEVCEEYL